MPRPTITDISSVLRALNFTAQKPSELSAKLNASRATIHRKLALLLDEGVVVKTGQGPTAGYRLPTPQEEFEKAQKELTGNSRIRVTLSGHAAYSVREALDAYSRIGIGQLEEVLSIARSERLYRHDGHAVELDDLDAAEPLMRALKQTLIDMAMNASFGVYSPHVQPQIRNAWGICRALRHRVAWDYTPEGSMGVWHDEPLRGDVLSSLVVVSEGPVGKEFLKQRKYHLEMDLDTAAVLEAALMFQSRVLGGDLSAILDMARHGLLREAKGGLVEPQVIEAATGIVKALESTLFGEQSGAARPSSNESLLLKSAVAQLQAVRQGKEADADAAEDDALPSEVAVRRVTDSPFSFSLLELPPEMLVSYKKGQYRVIGPGKTGDHLAILGESHSLQTAVMMARNEAAGGRARSTEF